jgi:hypothetical protein
MLWSSGVAGLGTNIVLRTSRRPRNVLDRLGCAACCSCLSICFPDVLGTTYSAQSVDQIGSSRISVAVFFLNRGISDVKLELRRWIALVLCSGSN